MKIVVFVFIFICIIGIGPGTSLADWQSTLEANFDIVDTFDNLQNWSGHSAGEFYHTNDPVKKDGTASMWSHWSAEVPHDGVSDDWISDHGSYTWNRTGSQTPKSVLIQENVLYQAGDDYLLGQGPSRLGTFFGNGLSGKSGYKKIHVFFMVKFRPGFFATTSTNPLRYDYMGYLKFFDILSGFTDINYFGTPSERPTLRTTVPQVTTVYGCNFTVVNWQSGGDTYGWSRILPMQSTPIALNYADGWGYGNSITRYATSGGVDIDDYYESDGWFGMEVAIDAGTVDTANGSFEIWIYNSSGVQMGYWANTSITTMVHFDHYFNKVVLGGNRTIGSAMPEDNRHYIDDFIIDDQEIAPTYFSLLSGQTPVYNSPTITPLIDQTVNTSSISINGSQTIDSQLTGTMTWEHGIYSGFCVLYLNTFTANITNLQPGVNTVTFTLTDSSNQTATDIVNINYIPITNQRYTGRGLIHH